MSVINELDVRVIPPREKHPTIHSRLHELAVGESLTIVNDHDPRPLRFELEADHPGQFHPPSAPISYEIAGSRAREARSAAAAN